MTYITLQDLLTIAAIAPLMIAAALFVLHLFKCWQRAATPQPVTDDLTELLNIAASPAPIVPDDRTLPALAKLYSVPGSSKWSLTRRLRASERLIVLSAIAA